jgi:protoporphyrinogen/coproporphyrinogen III oxidase
VTEPLSRALSEPDTRVVIIGGGVAGLVAARDCARPGFQVTLLEASDSLGGTVARSQIAGLPIDTGAESFATRGGHVAALLDELGLSGDVVTPNPAGAWLQLRDRAVPLPAGGLLGIPGSPLAKDVIAAIGWRGALRAYLDRLMPVLKIGHEQNFGRLVRRRMGAAVLERLVAPITTGVYSADPDRLEVAAAAPGLNQALTRLGSLSGAVTELRSSAKPGAAVGGIVGGMFRLVEILEADARARGAEIRTGARAVAIEQVPIEPDPAEVDPAEAQASGNERPARWAVAVDGGGSLPADAVLIATPAAQALALLNAISPETAALAELDWPAGTPVELATLVVDDPALDAAPRGSGLLVAPEAAVQPEPIRAKALTHSTAKWPWLHELAGNGRHVLRLSFGRVGTPSETAALSDTEFRDLAVTDASRLLGIPLQASTVIGFARTGWLAPAGHAVLGERHRTAAVRTTVESVVGLEVTGSWLCGTGLASVVPDAKEAASRVRGLRWRILTEKD